MEAILNRIKINSGNSEEQKTAGGIYICEADFSPVKISEECYYNGIEIEN